MSKKPIPPNPYNPFTLGVRMMNGFIETVETVLGVPPVSKRAKGKQIGRKNQQTRKKDDGAVTERFVNGRWVSDNTGVGFNHRDGVVRQVGANTNTAAKPVVPKPVVTKPVENKSDILDESEIIERYWRNGEPALCRAATIMTRPYSSALGVKIDYWTMFENHYKELELIKTADKDFDPEDFARAFVARMIREGQWKDLETSKFEAITKRVVATHYGVM
jgi:hypothetical protein